VQSKPVATGSSVDHQDSVDADPDIPILIAAKSEYAKLQ
jgi:hypothetical protein